MEQKEETAENSSIVSGSTGDSRSEMAECDAHTDIVAITTISEFAADASGSKEKFDETESGEKSKLVKPLGDGLPCLIADDPEEIGDEKQIKKQKQADDPSLLDLAFAMDCTGSMGSYIHQAQQNIRKIVEDIVAKEQADIRLALVQYRDHPPQDSSFVTCVNDFTTSVREMKGWLNGCSASGGGDGPEAVADGLYQVLKLSWRQEATKMCVLISDAPPHGLGLDGGGDGFPNGCPDGLDPMEIANKMAEKSITLYAVGCEPAINRYKQFFTALAHITGGQYVPLRKSNLLSAVIVGGAQEEISLQRLMEEVNEEVQQELENADDGAVAYDDLASRVHERMKSRGHQVKQMNLNGMQLPQASQAAQAMSYCTNMAEIRNQSKSSFGETERTRSSLSARKKKRTGATASEKAPSSSSSGGVLSGLAKWFGYADASAPHAGAASPPAEEEHISESMDDVYNVSSDEEIAQEQVHRMVAKSLAVKGLRKKTRAK